jgi:hypothetical protein
LWGPPQCRILTHQNSFAAPSTWATGPLSLKLHFSLLNQYHTEPQTRSTPSSPTSSAVPAMFPLSIYMRLLVLSARIEPLCLLRCHQAGELGMMLPTCLAVAICVGLRRKRSAKYWDALTGLFLWGLHAKTYHRKYQHPDSQRSWVRGRDRLELFPAGEARTSSREKGEFR